MTTQHWRAFWAIVVAANLGIAGYFAWTSWQLHEVDMELIDVMQKTQKMRRDLCEARDAGPCR